MRRSLKRRALGLSALLCCTWAPMSLGQPATPATVTAPALVEERSFPSAAMNSEMGYYVYLPKAYEAEPDQRFPVVYWLHGGGGWTPMRLTLLSEHFDTAMQAGNVPAMIVVFPVVHPRSLWVNWKDGSLPVEHIVVQDLVPHIDASFRTVASARGRVLEGGSMGGYGAARLGFKYPDLFGAVSMLNAGPLQEVLDPENAPVAGAEVAQATLNGPYGGDVEYFRAQSPWLLAAQNAGAIRGKVLVRQLVGGQDGTLENNRRFSEHLTELDIPHSFRVLPGVHHSPGSMFAALDDSYWEFFRTFLAHSMDAGGAAAEAEGD